MKVAEAVRESLNAALGHIDQPPQVLPETPTYEQIKRLEAAIPDYLDTLDIDEQTSHHFCEGLYCRQLDVPKGSVVVGKMHAKENFFILVKGDMTVWTPNGMKRVKAPFMVVTKPGDKRVGYAHEDCITMNFHANPDDEKDLEILESRYIIPEIGLLEDEQ